MSLEESSIGNDLSTEEIREAFTSSHQSAEDTFPTSSFTAVTAAIWLYGSPVIFILGIVGNVLTLLVMCRRTFRKSTTAIYLSILAIVDTAVLIFYISNDWVKYAFKFDIRSQTGPLCTATVFVLFYLSTFQPWLLVNLTIERLVVVCVPMKARFLFTRRRVCLGLTATALGSFALHAHTIWYVRLYDLQPGIPMCAFPPAMSQKALQAYSMLDMIVSTFLPFLLMFVLNACICHILYQTEKKWSTSKTIGVRNLSNRTVKAIGSGTDHSETECTTIDEPGKEVGKPEKSSSPKLSNTTRPKYGTISANTRSTTITLLLVTYAFLLLKAPRSALLLYQSIVPPDFNDQGRSDFVRQLWALCDLLVSTNSAINLLLYCVTGRKYRRELVDMFSFRRQ